MLPNHLPPSTLPLSTSQRDDEINKIVNGFVTPSRANSEIYRAVLERVLPIGSGIPGPVVTEDDLRQAVEAIKPGYKDVFRRVRELQGEEGLTGLVKQGTSYQLQHTAIAAKREPRRAVPDKVAQKVLLAQGSQCTVCRAPVATQGTKIDVDHRVPRLRGGNSHETNLQVLCRSCNIAKSTQCSNCTLDCNTCGWAFPEQYRPIKLNPNLVLQINDLARNSNRSPDDVANEHMQKALDRLRESAQGPE